MHRLLAATLLLLSFSWDGVQAAEKLLVGTPDPLNFSYAPIDIGVEIGAFAKRGLDIQRVDFGGGAKVHQAMTAGSINLAVAASSGFAYIARGAPERAVAATDKAISSLAFVVRADDPAKTVADLKGRTVGITTSGSAMDWLTRTVSVKYGWKSEGLKPVALGGMGALVAGLMAKNVDAIVGSTSESFILEKEKRARIVGLAGDEVKEIIWNVIFANQNLIEHKPEQVRGFIDGWFEAIDYINNNRADAIRIANKRMKLPEEVAARVYDLYLPLLLRSGRFDDTALAETKRAIIDSGTIQALPADKDLIDKSFVP